MAGIGKFSSFKGMNKVLNNLKKENKKMRGNVATGYKEAALIIKADAVRNAPIDVGNLRGSAFIEVTGKTGDNQNPSFEGGRASELAQYHSAAKTEMKAIVKGGGVGGDIISATVAFSAYYAFWVHEMPADYEFNGGGPQFLQRSLDKNENRVVESIKKWASV